MTGASLIASGRVPKMQRILCRAALPDVFLREPKGGSPHRSSAQHRRPARPQGAWHFRSPLSRDRNLKVPKARGPHQGEEVAEANQAEVEAVKIMWWPRDSSANRRVSYSIDGVKREPARDYEAM